MAEKARAETVKRPLKPKITLAEDLLNYTKAKIIAFKPKRELGGENKKPLNKVEKTSKLKKIKAEPLPKIETKNKAIEKAKDISTKAIKAVAGGGVGNIVKVIKNVIKRIDNKVIGGEFISKENREAIGERKRASEELWGAKYRDTNKKKLGGK